MWMTMATKSICYVIICMTVFFCTCFAVVVTVDNVGDVVEGSETRITCNVVRSIPGPTDPIITWNNVTNGVPDLIGTFLGGVGSVQPSYSDRFSVEGDTTTTLVIADTIRSDSGTYQCSVTIVDDNPVLDSGEGILNVIYLYKPVLSSFTTPVNESDTVEMSCSSDANPSPMYTFLRDGVNLPSGGSSTLTFQSVSRNNKGSYECRANNRAGTETSESRKLDVQYAPEITQLGNMEVSRGESVTIRFVVVANPTANYVWTTTPATTDTDNDPVTYTFTVSDTIDVTYTVTLVATNDVGTTQESVEVSVVARITTLMTTTNALTTLPPPDSCGALSIVSDGSVVDGVKSVNVDTEVVLYCRCGGSSSGNGFEYEWTLDGKEAGRASAELSFNAKAGGHDVVCKSTAGAPESPEVGLRINVNSPQKDTGGISTGAIVGIVVGIIVALVILAVVIVIVLKAREDGTSNKSADSAYMDVTWDTKDPNRVNQGKKTAPPINGNSKQEAAKPDPYEKYDRYGDERAYSRTSYGDDYNDKPDEDDYANSMPVTV